MNKLIQWYQSHTAQTHAIAASVISAVAFLTGAYAAVPQFKELADQYYAYVPTVVKQFAVTGIGLYAFYKTRQTKLQLQPPVNKQKFYYKHQKEN